MTAKYCRENKIPYFGICLGMQVMAVEFARHVLNLKDANTTEVDPKTKNPVISLLSEQREIQEMGGTMRLGASNACLNLKLKLMQLMASLRLANGIATAGNSIINIKLLWKIKDSLLLGPLNQGTLCEIAEIKDHPWMLGVQFHPEFKSKPTEPHPLFHAFVQAAIKSKQKQNAYAKP